jgi:ketosteroid isomerase-like protein
MSMDDDERQILALFEAGDKALMNADLDTLSGIFADDYVQYGEAGVPRNRLEILADLRSGAVRYPSIVSTGREIRVFGETAVVHGSELDEVEMAGRRFGVRYIYLDVLLRRNGEWKIVASQLARPGE